MRFSQHKYCEKDDDWITQENFVPGNILILRNNTSWTYA